jgi:NAD-dependent deacetylase
VKLSKNLANLLQHAQSICVLTGAGISAESGVPTFRGADGLWKKFRPEELANFDAFIANPQLVWEWYSYRRKLIETVAPNAGHTALARMEEYVEDFTLVTQNVDNLHKRAGSRRILELHGNIMRSLCIDCGKREEHPVFSEVGGVPKCKSCGGFIRPDVVWLGEMLPSGIFEEAEAAAQRCALFLSVGTSALVYPAALLPITAKQSGAYTVEINIEPTELSSRFDESIFGKAGEVLPLILESLPMNKGVKP